MTSPQPRYSGPGKSGVCVCGHPWYEHHLGFVARQAYVNATGEGYIPQECEHFGFNENGGRDAEGEAHCGSYRDKGDA
jgi:hypothetical protein